MSQLEAMHPSKCSGQRALKLPLTFLSQNLNFSENLDDITCKLYLEPDNSPLPLSHLAQPPPSLTWIILEPSNWSLSSYPAPALCQLSSSQPVPQRDSGKSQFMPRLLFQNPPMASHHLSKSRSLANDFQASCTCSASYFSDFIFLCLPRSSCSSSYPCLWAFVPSLDCFLLVTAWPPLSLLSNLQPIVTVSVTAALIPVPTTAAPYTDTNTHTLLVLFPASFFPYSTYHHLKY